MDRADTAATPTSGAVGLATSLTQVRDPGWPFRAVGNRSLELNLEDCQPSRVVSDCKGVVKALQAIQSGHRLPKGRHRDLE
eukprot:5708294-Amphidinium_carterae.1